MSSSKLIRIVYKNDLSAYLGCWKTDMNIMEDAISRNVSAEKAERFHIVRYPRPFESFFFNNNDFSLMLTYLDDKLRVLEETPITPSQFPYQSYNEAIVFLKVCYIFFIILLDNIAGIISYFYQHNEPAFGEINKFLILLTKADKGKIPDKNFSELIRKAGVWFQEVRKRRNDLVHNHETLLISLKQNPNGVNITGQFSTTEGNPIDYKDIRGYFGFVLCEYQKFIDNLLDHFDHKFDDWYGLGQGKSSRTVCILEGNSGIILWWAYRYGNYRNDELQVIEKNDIA
jgi:hypothetical protein